MVSIVIPTFNRAKLLKESIESALGQDYSSFEVIVVDDGSSDETPTICEKYGNRVRYFSVSHRGPAAAEDFGIRQMRGEWLKVLGDDDILESNALSTFVEWAGRTGSRLLSCGFVHIDAQGKVIGDSIPGRVTRQDEFFLALWSRRGEQRHILFGGAGGGLGFVHGSPLFEVGLLDERPWVGEDWEWLLRAVLGIVSTICISL
jgi:glycosyltransferase involved in cell wall biosynthesis